MAWTTARMKAAQDEAGTGVSHVQWSENGTTETSNLARTAVTLGAATTANPSVIANNAEITSAEASGAATITHFAFSGGTGGADLFTTWVALDNSRTLGAGDKLVAAAGALKENLYQATSEPV